MATLDYFSNPEPVPTGTLTELYLDTVDRFGAAPALRRFVSEDRFETLSYRETLDRVHAVVAAMDARGLTVGDRAGILSDNRPEWAIADYACLCAGVTDVPIYPTLTAEQIAFILDDAEVRLLFVEGEELLEKALEARKSTELLERIVVFDPPAGTLPDGVEAWPTWIREGAETTWDVEAFRTRALERDPEDLATLIYTSGTTGTPKGVMLTHNNLFSNVKACQGALEVTLEDDTLSFLPLSHVFQRMVDYLLFSAGCTITYARTIDTVAADLKVAKPTVVVSVPRLYEKVYSKIMEADGLRGKLVQWAREVGAAWAEERLAGREPSPILKLVYRLADRLVFRKIRAGVGGRLRIFVSGGAPLSPELNRFFYSVGLTILEGYGLTETSPVTNVNTLENFRIGTVGKPVAGTEIKIDPDGEILVRGPQVMKGYYNRPDDTAEVLEDDGWFRTGDIGMIDEDGFLTITDRKKSLIKTSGGKYVAPQPIENSLKTLRWVEQVMLLGDKRNFVSLLIVPSFDALEKYAKEKGLSWSGRDELVRLPAVQEAVEDAVFEELDDLARYETPKKIGLITEPFSIEDGTLTPSQKVRRREVEKKYEDLIEAFYREENFEKTVFVEGDA